MVIGFDFLSYVFLTFVFLCLFVYRCEISFVILANLSSVKTITKTGGKIKIFRNLKISLRCSHASILFLLTE